MASWAADQHAHIIPRTQVSLEEQFLNIRIFLRGDTEPIVIDDLESLISYEDDEEFYWHR
jgi:hypothetical protein